MSLLAHRIFTFVRSRRGGVTCDECLTELGVPHQSGSARFHDLVASKCLVQTRWRRKTVSGRTAHVYVVPEGVTFESYRTRAAKRLPNEAAEKIVTTFVQAWPLAKNDDTRKKLVTRLVRDLCKLARNAP